MHQVESLALLSARGEKGANDLYVFPDRFFRYIGAIHPQVRFIANMFNFETKVSYFVYGSQSPSQVDKEEPIDEKLRSYFRHTFLYLLEANWFKIEPLRPLRAKIGKVEVDGRVMKIISGDKLFISCA